MSDESQDIGIDEMMAQKLITSFGKSDKDNQKQYLSLAKDKNISHKKQKSEKGLTEILKNQILSKIHQKTQQITQTHQNIIQNQSQPKSHLLHLDNNIPQEQSKQFHYQQLHAYNKSPTTYNFNFSGTNPFHNHQNQINPVYFNPHLTPRYQDQVDLKNDEKKFMFKGCTEPNQIFTSVTQIKKAVKVKPTIIQILSSSPSSSKSSSLSSKSPKPSKYSLDEKKYSFQSILQRQRMLKSKLFNPNLPVKKKTRLSKKQKSSMFLEKLKKNLTTQPKIQADKIKFPALKHPEEHPQNYLSQQCSNQIKGISKRISSSSSVEEIVFEQQKVTQKHLFSQQSPRLSTESNNSTPLQTFEQSPYIKNLQMRQKQTQRRDGQNLQYLPTMKQVKFGIHVRLSDKSGGGEKGPNRVAITNTGPTNAIKNTENMFKQPDLSIMANEFKTPTQASSQIEIQNRMIGKMTNPLYKSYLARRMLTQGQPLDLGVLSINQVVEQAYHCSILTRQVYNQFLNTYSFEKVKHFLKLFSNNRLSEWKSNGLNITIIHHRRLSQLLVKLYPNNYRICTPLSLDTQSCIFLNTLYELSQKDYQTMTGILDNQSKINIWKPISLKYKHVEHFLL